MKCYFQPFFAIALRVSSLDILNVIYLEKEYLEHFENWSRYPKKSYWGIKMKNLEAAKVIFFRYK